MLEFYVLNLLSNGFSRNVFKYDIIFLAVNFNRKPISF